MATVSIIIAAYNAEKTIQISIESIISQTFQDFEIIVCDDNSTDQTVEILKEIQKKEPRLILLRNTKNLKAAASRNKCIEKSKGKYIAIQDADDFSHPDRLELQVDFLNKNPFYDFVSTRMFKFEDHSDYKKLMELSSLSETNQYVTTFVERPENRDFLKSNPYIHAPTMFRIDALRSVGGYRVSKETIRGQDADLFMRLHIANKRGRNLKNRLYYYHENNATFKRRKYVYRINSTKVRLKRFKEMRLMPLGYLYAVKPLLVGLFPPTIIKKLKKISCLVN